MSGMRRHVRSPALARKRGGGPSLITFFIWTFFLVSAAIAYLWIYNQNDVAVADLVEKQQTIAELENDNRELQVFIDKLSQIDRITHIARKELGMVIPAAESLIVYLEMPAP